MIPSQRAGSEPVTRAGVRPGRRHGGRTSHQEEQRSRTREKLLNSGITVFSVRPYFDATIDDLIRAASVSRAAFYMHFNSKLDLAFAVFESGISSWWELFRELPTITANDYPSLRAWMARLLELYRSRRYVPRLHSELEPFEPRFQARMEALNDALIETLAATIPAFAATQGDGALAQRARARALLLINQLGTMCAKLASHPPSPDEDVYLDLMTEQLAVFLYQ